ncbi:unnamed protein product [Staurois parvus]|uniref:Uncharacterized protein n=1 Tax=Staurois parvus TaxID=386267 RepID=A0ABN9BG67_9NEOB|nr:unnamed protein product [Staurois parvus]
MHSGKYYSPGKRQTQTWAHSGLVTVGDFCASACAGPTLSFYVAYHFLAKLLFPVASTLLEYH